MHGAFSSYHPSVNFLYFALVIGFSMFFMHPVCLAVSFFCALTVALTCNSRRAVRLLLFGVLPILLFTAILSPLFNHEGATILAYLPDGNPLTLESMVYGVAAAFMMVTVILWFSCYNNVMTSDKFIYLFGRILPALSLLLSMTLRFVPRFIAQLKIIANAQRCIRRDAASGSLFRRAKNGIAVLSVMITWALESAVTTADSMKSRGYGLKGRTAFSNYNFTRRDAGMLLFYLVSFVYLCAGKAAGGLVWRYYPMLRGELTGFFSMSVYLVYFTLCISPVLVNWREDRKWHTLKSGR